MDTLSPGSTASARVTADTSHGAMADSVFTATTTNLVPSSLLADTIVNGTDTKVSANSPPATPLAVITNGSSQSSEERASTHDSGSTADIASMTQTQKSLSEQALPEAPLLLPDFPDPLAALMASAEQSDVSNDQQTTVILATDVKGLDQTVFPTPNSPPMQQRGHQREEMHIKLEDTSIDLSSEDPATVAAAAAAAAADLMSLNVSSTMMQAQQQHQQQHQQQQQQQQPKSHDQLLATSFDTSQSQLDMLSNLTQTSNAAAAAAAAAFNTNYPPSISTSMDMLGSSHAMNNYPMMAAKTELRIVGNLDTVLYDWPLKERQERRRLVEFAPHRSGNTITCTFQPITSGDHKPPHIVVSCIFWEERGDCFITSVDCIHLLESLIGVRFQVEEKNRIRRNLEGFRPITVSKCKPETAEFFKLIMSFPNPKPRNIEKDVKVFPWRTLPHALRKIVNKYQPAISNASSLDLNMLQRGVSGAASNGLMLSSPMTSTLAGQGHGASLDRQHRYGYHPYPMGRRFSHPAMSTTTAHLLARSGNGLDMPNLSKEQLQSLGINAQLYRTAGVNAANSLSNTAGTANGASIANPLSSSGISHPATDPLGGDATTPFDMEQVSSQANSMLDGWPTAIDEFDATLGLSPRTQQQLRQAGLGGRRHSIADPYSLRQASQHYFDLVAASDTLGTSLAGLTSATRMSNAEGRDTKQEFIDFNPSTGAPPPAGLNVFP